MLNTPEVRDCIDAHAGLGTSGARHARFLQAAFFLYAFRTMVPRNRAHHIAKPASARSCLDSVRRVHKCMDIVMCPAPSVALVLKGLMDEYVHLHGAEILAPKRREPLINEQTTLLIGIAPETKLASTPPTGPRRCSLTLPRSSRRCGTRAHVRLTFSALHPKTTMRHRC